MPVRAAVQDGLDRLLGGLAQVRIGAAGLEDIIGHAAVARQDEIILLEADPVVIEEFFFGQEKVKVIACDGHTIGHISFWFPNSRALFVGDTIFSLGCGALFEGSAREMWNSLERLRALPEDTLVYCAHEYTLENAAYAITAEPEISRLKGRVEEAKRQIASGCFTVPSSLASEKACNPFLRPESSEIQRKVKMEGKPLWEVFAAIRKDKDLFDSNS